MRKSLVLVVDDTHTSKGSMPSMLDRSIYDLIVVGHAHQAAKAIARLFVDLVMIDMSLPIFAIEVCRALRCVIFDRAVPVVVVLPREGRAMETCALEAGADELLIRPIQRLDVRVLVADLLLLRSHLALARSARMNEQVLDGEPHYLHVAPNAAFSTAPVSVSSLHAMTGRS